MFPLANKNYVLWKHAYKRSLLNANCDPWFCALLKLPMKMTTHHVMDTMCVHLIFTNCLYSLENLQTRNCKNYCFHCSSVEGCMLHRVWKKRAFSFKPWSRHCTIHCCSTRTSYWKLLHGHFFFKYKHCVWNYIQLIEE